MPDERQVKLLAIERRPQSPARLAARERLQLKTGIRAAMLGQPLREIPIGLAFYLEEGGPEYRVIELKVKGMRAYATVEQLTGYGAGRFTVNMTLREVPAYPGELVAVLPLT